VTEVCYKPYYINACMHSFIHSRSNQKPVCITLHLILDLFKLFLSMLPSLIFNTFPSTIYYFSFYPFKTLQNVNFSRLYYITCLSSLLPRSHYHTSVQFYKVLVGLIFYLIF